MMRELILLIVLGLSLVNSQGYWKQVWSDEFDGTEVDLTKWQFEENCNVKNEELQCYTARKDNARVANGKLTITAKPEQYGNKQYTSARLNTAKSASWLYGRFEMSAKLPNGKHLWPAFWMLPTDYKYGTWAASGEIDIMEYRGQVRDKTQGTLHFGAQWPNNINSGSGPVSMNVDLSVAFHNYACEWDRDEIRWYFDNKLFHKISLVRNFWSGKGVNPYTAMRQPFDQRFNFIINLAVGGNFFNSYGTLTTQEAAAWPDRTFVIDYIRAYQWSTGVPPTVSSTPPAISATVKSSTAVTPKTSAVVGSSSDELPEETTVVSDPLEQNIADGNQQADADKKIMGMSKPVLAGVFAGIGLLIIVVVIVAVVWYRRRARRTDMMNQTELAVPGEVQAQVPAYMRQETVPIFVVGQTCLAKYSDGVFYPVTIEAIQGVRCQVNYGADYGWQRDWISTESMKPL
jgi:beta-glucanase (GH16 family)